MIIGDRIREFREAKNLSQTHISQRTGLLRSYISRVENGHTIPSVETLEKFAQALGIPLYQLFHDTDQPPVLPNLSGQRSTKDVPWGSSGKDVRYLVKFRRHLSRMNEDDRRLVFLIAQKLSIRRRPAARRPGAQHPPIKSN